MSRLRPRLARAAVLLTAMALLGGCAHPDGKPAEKSAVSSGDVAPAAPAAAGMTSGLTDSTSARADRGRIRGSEAATVWLIEISDFQCPFCKRWHDEVSAVLDREYVQTGKVRRAYINFPLSSIHPNARAASETAMCASVQGKFWEVQNALFATQERWAAMPAPAAMFDSLAVASGVDAAGWRACMQSHATLPLIDADRERATTAGVKSTPTFFVGSRGMVGAYPVDSFRVVIDSALAKARGAR